MRSFMPSFVVSCLICLFLATATATAQPSSPPLPAPPGVTMVPLCSPNLTAESQACLVDVIAAQLRARGFSPPVSGSVNPVPAPPQALPVDPAAVRRAREEARCNACPRNDVSCRCLCRGQFLYRGACVSWSTMVSRALLNHTEQLNDHTANLEDIRRRMGLPAWQGNVSESTTTAPPAPPARPSRRRPRRRH